MCNSKNAKVRVIDFVEIEGNAAIALFWSHIDG